MEEKEDCSQHRSVDTVDYGGRLEEVRVDGALASRRLDDPLLVATHLPPQQQQFYRPPPLSNPVNSAAAFWNPQPGMAARF